MKVRRLSGLYGRLARHRPAAAEPLGWLFTVVGLLAAIQVFARGYGFTGSRPSPAPSHGPDGQFFVLNEGQGRFVVGDTTFDAVSGLGEPGGEPSRDRSEA